MLLLCFHHILCNLMDLWVKKWQESNNRWCRQSSESWQWTVIIETEDDDFFVVCQMVMTLSMTVVMETCEMNRHCMHVILLKTVCKALVLQNYPPFQHGCILLPWQQYIHLLKNKPWSVNYQHTKSFVIDRSQTNTQCDFLCHVFMWANKGRWKQLCGALCLFSFRNSANLCHGCITRVTSLIQQHYVTTIHDIISFEQIPLFII